MYTYTSFVAGTANFALPNAYDEGSSSTTNSFTNSTSYSNSDERGFDSGQGSGNRNGVTYDVHTYQTIFTTLVDSDGFTIEQQKTSNESYSFSYNDFSNGGRYGGGMPPYAGGSAEVRTVSAEHYLLANSYLLSGGIYIEKYDTFEAYFNSTYTESGSGGTGTQAYNTSLRRAFSTYQRVSYYIKEYIYRGGETRYNNSTYSTNYYLDVGRTSSSSSSYSTSYEYITTLFNTCEFTSSYTTSTTNTDTFFPTIGTTITDSYSGRCYFINYGTAEVDATNSPLKLSSQSSIEFVFLTHTTEGSGSNTYLTITTSLSTASRITTYTTDGKYAKGIDYTSYTDYYSDFGNRVTGLVTAGANWAWGNVGAVLVRNGGANASFINKFTDLLIVTQNTIFEPNETYNKYGVTLDTNNQSFTYTGIQAVFVETTVPILTYEETAIKSYYFDDEAGSVASTTILTYYETTFEYTTLIPTTEIFYADCPAGKSTAFFLDTALVGISTALTRLWSNTPTTIKTYTNYITTFTNYSQSNAVTSISTEVSSTYDYDNGEEGGTTYQDAYSSYQSQSLTTETAKSYSHVGFQFLEGLKVLRKFHGDGAVYSTIYLHTSNSNKTDNTGYYIYSNNLSNDVYPVYLEYNATDILSNGQLINYQTNADEQYASANFGYMPAEFYPSFIGTPISQSSYSWYYVRSGSITRITASFGGVSDSASYTKITQNSLTSSSTSGLITFYFAEPASSHLEFAPFTESIFWYVATKQAIGGKQVLYTGKDTIYPKAISAQFVYTGLNSISTSSVDHIYYQTNFGVTGGSTGSSSNSGAIASGTSEAANLKYVRLNNDSWVVVDHHLDDGNIYFGGVVLASPTTVFEELTPYVWTSVRGINGNFKSYYGSTYLN
jgi:hypothetical protein